MRNENDRQNEQALLSICDIPPGLDLAAISNGLSRSEAVACFAPRAAAAPRLMFPVQKASVVGVCAVPGTGGGAKVPVTASPGFANEQHRAEPHSDRTNSPGGIGTLIQ